ncbi:hypothetical protein BC829DRAFT_390429 [Chytridium lagenaria]|nr:hypothetical protein BC829DRAFT_390429 [Chytridium lagenaria]
MSKELRAAQSEVDVYHNQMREEDEKRQRLETLVASERSQRVRLERVKTELEARVAGFETRIAAMGSGDGAEEEKKELMERVKDLEEELRNQGEVEKRKTEMEVRFESLGLLMEERDRRSLSPRPGISGEEGRRGVSPGRGEKKGKKTDERVDTEDPLEKRIKEELEITKRQVKTYEWEQIEKRFKDVGKHTLKCRGIFVLACDVDFGEIGIPLYNIL